MHLTLPEGGTLIERVLQTVRAAVRDGRLEPGERLPSSRQLAADLGISRNVVLIAFNQLLAEGYLVARQGSGTFVAEQTGVAESRATKKVNGRRPLAAEHPATLSPLGAWLALNQPMLPLITEAGSERRYACDFRYGRVAFDGIARTTWSRLLARCARAANATALAPVEGDPQLRATIADHLRYARGIRVDADAVLITQGVQEALDLTARLLISPGARAVLEDPHYLPARMLMQAHGAQITAVPVDSEGLRASELPEGPIRLAYVTPSHQFPLGSVMSLARRQKLLAWAARRGALIFEDDYDSQFRYDARPVESLASLDASRVIYAGSFSKTIAPGLRLGYLVVPDALIEPFRRIKALAGSGAPLVVQQAVAAFVGEGHFARHLRRASLSYAANRKALLNAIHQHFADRAEVLGAAAGVHVVMRVKDRRARDASGAMRRAAAAGVGVRSIEMLYAQSARAELELLMSYACTAPAGIEHGVARLAEVL